MHLHWQIRVNTVSTMRCWRCRGAGRFTCHNCNGRGQVVLLTANAADPDTDVCPDCRGTGLTNCLPCGGSGHFESA